MVNTGSEDCKCIFIIILICAVVREEINNTNKRIRRRNQRSKYILKSYNIREKKKWKQNQAIDVSTSKRCVCNITSPGQEEYSQR